MASIDIQITVDDERLKEQLAAAEKALDDFQKQAEAASATVEVNVNAEGVEQAAGQMEGAAEQAEKATKIFDKLSDDPKVAKLQKEINSLAQSLVDCNRELEKEAAALEDMEKALQRAINAGDTAEVERLTATVAQQAAKVEQLNATYNKTATAMGKGINMLKRLAPALVPDELQGLADSLLGVGEAALEGGKSAGVWGAAISAAVALAGAAISKFREEAEKARRIEEQFRQSVASNMAEQAVLFQKLKEEYNAIADDDAMNDWLERSQDNFRELGVSVDTAAEAENLFVANADNYVASIEARAKATAYMKVASDAWEEYMKKMLEAEKKAAEGNGTDFMVWTLSNMSTGFGSTQVPMQEKGTAYGKREAERIEGEAKKEYDQMMAAVRKAIKQEGDAANIWDMIFGKADAGGGNNEPAKSVAKMRDLADDIIKLNREIAASSILSGGGGTAAQIELADRRLEWAKEDAEAQKAVNLAAAQSRQEREQAEALYNAQIEVAENKHAEEMAKIRAKEQRDIEKGNAATVKSWQAYAQQLTQIITERDNDIKALNDNSELSEGQRASAAAEVEALAEYRLSKAAEAVGAEAGNIEGELIAMVQGAMQQSIVEIVAQLQTLKDEVDGISLTGGLTEKQLDLVRRYTALQTALNAKVKEGNKATADGGKKSNTTFKGTMKLLSDVKDVVGDVSTAFGDLLSDGAKEALSAAENIATGTISMITAIQTLSSAASKEMSAIERASVILTAISAAVQVIGAVTKYISNNLSASAKAAKQLEKAQQAASNWSTKMNTDELNAQATTGGSGGEYWQKQLKAVNDYRKAVELAEAVEKAAGEAYNKYIRRWIQTGEGRASRLSEYYEAREATAQAKANLQSQLSAISEEFLQTTPESLASSIADSIVDGFDSGLSDSKEMWNRSIDDMMRQMLKAQLTRQLTDVFKTTFAEISGYLDDGVITAGEAADIQSRLDEARETAQKNIDMAKQIYDVVGLADSASVSADTGSLAQASQDSIDLLTGIATSIQGLCYTMNDNINALAQNNADSLVVLRAIQGDTARLAAIEAGIGNIKSHLDDIATRGVKAL